MLFRSPPWDSLVYWALDVETGGGVPRALPAPTTERRLLAVSMGVVAGVWVVLIIVTEVLRAR